MAGEVKVLAWNGRGGLGDEERSGQMVGKILSHEPTVAFIAEANAEQAHDSDTLHVAKERLQDEGYVVLSGLYDDTDGRRDRHGWIALGRGAESAESISLGTRMAARMGLTNPHGTGPYEFYGVHLDDRSEPTRRQQAARLIADHIDCAVPTIVAGDFNAMHGKDRMARSLRAIKPLINVLPKIDPQEYHDLNGMRKKLKLPARVGSLATRVVEMAEGSTMVDIEKFGLLSDADDLHQPTMSARRPLFQLDHIMYRGFNVSDAGVSVHDASDLSDHRAISATLYPR